jgi:hypothetical protein
MPYSTHTLPSGPRQPESSLSALALDAPYRLARLLESTPPLHDQALSYQSTRGPSPLSSSSGRGSMGFMA